MSTGCEATEKLPQDGNDGIHGPNELNLSRRLLIKIGLNSRESKTDFTTILCRL